VNDKLKDYYLLIAQLADGERRVNVLCHKVRGN